MSDCELLSTCPFFNDRMHSEMPEMYKEQYCEGDYAWCGRYLGFKALQKELEREKVPSDLCFEISRAEQRKLL